MDREPDYSDILNAHQRIKSLIHRTPVMRSTSLDEMVGASLFFKCENLQRVGAFKFRGACNAVFSLPRDKMQYGVATHSSGNHAAALSLAAGMRGLEAHIVMPRTAPQIKVNAVRNYGGKIYYCEPTQKAREENLEEVLRQTHAEFVHPYNDYRVIAGQATCALEFLEDVADLDIILTPVGGGGLLSGTALTIGYKFPQTKVIAAEPAGADDAFRSLKAGKILPSENPDTIADGLKTSLGSKTFPIIQQYVDQIITVEDAQIINAMRYIWERMKIIVEPSAAVPFGALLENKINIQGKRLGIILSGGNVDLDCLPWSQSRD
jgi:threonine dehydratase